jgi:hypothetical protein
MMRRELSGVRADRSYSYADLEKLAAYVRDQLKMSPHEAIKPLELFEGLDDITIGRSAGKPIPLRGGVEALDDSEGYTRYNGQHEVIEVLASELMYQWLEERRPRAGYFVAHELGHCVLHTDQLVRLAQMPTNQQEAFHRGGRAGHKAYEDTEWQANAFASALMMPAKGLAALEQECGGKLWVGDVVDRFGVSLEAAGYRLELWDARRAQLLSA